MSATRRSFLKQTLGSSALVSVGLAAPQFVINTAYAAAEGRKAAENILVVVQLSGGNDGLNTVVPFRDPLYAKNRTILNVGASQVLKVDDNVGLHPRMTGFAELLSRNQLAIVQGVGYPNPDRSHFRSMDIWHSADPAVTQPRDGWLGRVVERQRNDGSAMRDTLALHLGGSQLPLALTSRSAVVPSIDNVEQFKFRTDGGAVPLSELRKLSETPRADASLLDFVRRGTLNAFDSSEQVQHALIEPASRVAYPVQYALARKLRSIAQLIDAGLGTRIYYVSLAGFDTHANQAAAHGNLLAEFADSVDAFLKDLQARGHADRTLLLAFSEFGRRVGENASQGTDHGTAGPVFLAGGRVKPGLIGKHPRLDDLDQEGDLKFHTDFRQIYVAVLESWLKCPSTTVLSGTFSPIRFLNT